MAVALNNLIGNQRRFKPALFAYVGFNPGGDLRESPDRPRNLTDTNILDCFLKPGEMARHFLIPESELQAEGDRLGVYAMGAADHDRPLVFVRLTAQHPHQILDVPLEDCRRFFELNRQRRIHDVGRGHAHVKIAGIVADRFRHRAQECDDFVFDLAFDLADALYIEARFLTDARYRGFRDFTEPREAFRGEDFDIEPLLKAIFFRPDAAHFRSGVAGNHASKMPLYRSKVQRSKNDRPRIWSYLVAVGIALAGDPPHGSGRAELPHPALALGHNADVAEE